MIGRIQDRQTFERLRRDGARIRIDPLWCSYVPDAGVAPARAAFAIGRGTGTAVTRNRLRRRLRAILGAADVPGGLLVIGAKPTATELTFSQLEQVVWRIVDEMKRLAPT